MHLGPFGLCLDPQYRRPSTLVVATSSPPFYLLQTHGFPPFWKRKNIVLEVESALSSEHTSRIAGLQPY